MIVVLQDLARLCVGIGSFRGIFCFQPTVCGRPAGCDKVEGVVVLPVGESPLLLCICTLG